MIIFRVVLFFIIMGLMVHGAAASENDDILKKAQNLNVSVPQKGTALAGTKESMTEMTEWLNDVCDALISFFQNIMNMLGMGNATYTQNMTKTMDWGVNLSKSGTKK